MRKRTQTPRTHKRAAAKQRIEIITAFLINPEALSITPVLYQPHDIRDMSRFLDCRMATFIPTGFKDDVVWVDEEYLCKFNPPKYGFLIATMQYPVLWGKGLVVGSDDHYDASPKVSFDWLYVNVRFCQSPGALPPF